MLGCPLRVSSLYLMGRQGSDAICADGGSLVDRIGAGPAENAQCRAIYTANVRRASLRFAAFGAYLAHSFTILFAEALATAIEGGTE